MRRKIDFTISGGLGNQLFQYWMGAEVQRSTKTEVQYNSARVNRHKTPREMELSEFNIENLLTIRTNQAPRIVSMLSQTRDSILLRSSLFRKLLSLIKKYYFATEVGFDQSPEFYTRFTRVTGHFQSHIYLDGSRENILLEMELRNPSEKYLELCALMEIDEPIVVHARGGDYMALKESFGVLDASYYIEAIGLAREYIGHKGIWLFSDDPGRVQYLIDHLDVKVKYVVCGEEGLSNAESMKLISKGKVIVISNSTFSWWGAWLSSAQKIIAPSKWFRGLEDPKGLYPENWTLVESRWI